MERRSLKTKRISLPSQGIICFCFCFCFKKKRICRKEKRGAVNNIFFLDLNHLPMRWQGDFWAAARKRERAHTTSKAASLLPPPGAVSEIFRAFAKGGSSLQVASAQALLDTYGTALLPSLSRLIRFNSAVLVSVLWGLDSAPPAERALAFGLVFVLSENLGPELCTLTVSRGAWGLLARPPPSAPCCPRVYLTIKNLISSTSAETWQKDRLGKRMETRLVGKLRPARTCASVFSFRLLADLVEVAARSFRERRLLDELLYVAQKTGSMMSRSTLECTRCGNSLGVCSETIGAPFVQVQKNKVMFFFVGVH